MIRPGAALAAALAAALPAACATAEPPSRAVSSPSTTDWRQVDADTGKITDAEGLERLAEAFPASSSVRLRLLNAQLAAKDFAGLIATLSWLEKRGYEFSQTARTQIPRLVGDAHAEQASQLLLKPAPPVERSSVHATAPAEAGLVESVLVDSETGRMAATSVSTRSLWGAGGDGNWRPYAPEGAGNLSGIVFEPGRNTIWVASGIIDGSERPGFAGLYEVPPGTAPARRIPAPDGVTLSDLHRAAGGAIYASDPIGGGVYVLRSGADGLETLVPPGTFRSPQGLATSADGRLLYVSDYRYGIAVVPLDGGAPALLTTDLPLILDGVDGLWRRGDELIAMQNGTSPMRISAFRLSRDGMRVIGHRVLERAHSEWTEPLSGHLGPDALYYVGNGQWDRWIASEPAAGKPFGPTQIRRLPLER